MKDKFFDRKNYLETLQKRASALKQGYRQNIAIIGDELVGKTALIHKFIHKFTDPCILILYLELRHESKDSFIRRFIGVLLYNFLINSNMPLEEDLDFLIERSQRYAPGTIEKIRFILKNSKNKKNSGQFSELLSLCELLYEETGKRCVVILDEFHILEELGFRNLYRDWSKLLITQKDTMYVIISSRKFKTKAILAKDLSLLFGNFEVITVEPFDIKTSEQFLEYKLGGLALNPGLKDFIVYFTGGYPLYLEVIAGMLVKSKQSDLPEIMENLLFEETGILNQRFSNYIKRFCGLTHSNDYLSILHLISSGRSRIKDIAHMLHKSREELNLRINQLLEFDVISRSEDFLTINERVFGFWLKFVHQQKLNSLTFDAKNQREGFRQNINNMIQGFLRQAQKPIMERMSELLRLFEDENMRIEKKKIKLNHFREVKRLEFNNKNLREGLLGRSHDSLWIIAFKEDLFEDDIAEFSRECRKYRHKMQRKIIITLKDIDTNTKLRAMEEKVWTWDINNLNQIFDLFSQPGVIA